MRPLRLASGFFVRLVLYYCVLVALWGPVSDGYARLFRATATAVFRTSVGGGQVRFEPLPHPGRMWDTELVCKNLEHEVEGVQPFGTRYLGYAPTGMLLALILASPVPWGRRGWAILWGLLFIHAWTALGLWLMIWNGYSGDNILAVYSLGPAAKKTLSFITETVTTSTVTRYAVPTFFWALTTFRRQDLEELRDAVRPIASHG